VLRDGVEIASPVIHSFCQRMYPGKSIDEINMTLIFIAVYVHKQSKVLVLDTI
jgi:hypothetical protein